MADERPQLFPVAPQEEVLPSISVSGGGRRWVIPVVSEGRFRKFRARLGFLLIAFFVLAPIVHIGGLPALMVDVLQRRIVVFGAVFDSSDNLILLAFGANVVLSIFILTSLFGRVWCGYLCPQPIYMEFVFRPLEYLIAGPPQLLKKDRPWTGGRILRAVVLYGIYVVIAAFLAHTFTAYFLGWSSLIGYMTDGPAAHFGPFFAAWFVSALMVFDFGWFRDQTCTTACPYGRLQTILYDGNTSIVGYDFKRGEPRGKVVEATNGAPGGVKPGDCIDCGRCVATCPTGIDIRRGLQMECIGCAQCNDACDDVMTRLKRPRGLIRMASQNALRGEKTAFIGKRVMAYGAVMAFTIAMLLHFVGGREPAEVEILRTGRDVYKMLPGDLVANQLAIKFTNHAKEKQTFTFTLENADAELIAAVSPVAVEPGEIEGTDVVVKMGRSKFKNGKIEGRFSIVSDKGFKTERTFLLLGPYE